MSRPRAPRRRRRRGGRADPEALLEGLNPQQRAAVVHEGAPLLIVAGAGSGKTRVLTHRIAYLLAERDAQPGADPRDHLHQQGRRRDEGAGRRRSSARAPRPMWVSTFHSACVRILRARGRASSACKSSFSIYDAADSQRLMTLVCRDLDLDPKRYPPRSLSRAGLQPQERAGRPRDASRPRPTNHLEKTLAEAYALYQQRLREANALDFDDLIMTTVHLLQAFPDVAEHYRRRFRHVLVDEYQDTNHAQYVLVRELVGRLRRRADERAAGRAVRRRRRRPVDLRVPRRDHPQHPRVRAGLPGRDARSCSSRTTARPRRSSPPPTRSSRATRGRKPKNLWTDAGDGAQIVGYVADNEHDEAAFVAEEIDRLTDEGDAQPGDVAVFYRTNAQSRVFEEVFIRVGLPYKVVGGVRFYERRRSATRWPTCGCSPTPTTRSPCAGSSTCPSAASATGPRRCVEALAERERITVRRRRCGGPTRRPGSRPGRSTRDRRASSR